jgi:hypothetical protein
MDFANAEHVCSLLCAARAPGVEGLMANLTATTFRDVNGVRTTLWAC